MESKILKLCRRLKRCTLEDIVQFTELDTKQILPVIYYLLDNDYLEEKGGVYFPKNKTEPVNNENSFYFKQQYHSKEETDTIIKGFCLQLPVSKIKYFLNCKESSIAGFYQIFRQKIYEIDKPLRSPFEDLKTRAELKEFRKVYCFLRRVCENYNREIYLYHHLAEAIWRRNKSFEEMYSDLKNLLKI